MNFRNKSRNSNSDLLHISHPALPVGCRCKRPEFWHQMKGMNQTPDFCQRGCVKAEFGNADELIHERWLFLPQLPDKALSDDFEHGWANREGERKCEEKLQLGWRDVGCQSVAPGRRRDVSVFWKVEKYSFSCLKSSFWGG